MAKVHAIILNNATVGELDQLVRRFMRTDGKRSYFYAESFDHDGAFLSMRVKHVFQDGSTADVDIAVPLGHVNCILAAANERQIGFLQTSLPTA